MSLEYDSQLMLASEVSSNLQAVGLNFGNAQSSQARHFSRVWRDDESSSAVIQLAGPSFEGVQRVRIHNYIDDRRRVATLGDPAHEFGSLGIARNARADRERLAFQQRIEGRPEGFP